MVMYDFCSFNIRGLHNKVCFAKDFVNNLQLQLFAVMETRVKEKDALVFSTKVHRGFDWIFNYQHHRNGRIWLGWNPLFWSAQHLTSSAQQITCRITRVSDNLSFVWTVVYALNDLCDRRGLWLELEQIKNQWIDSGFGQSWCISGDFNSFLFAHETNGSPPRDTRIVTEFKDCVHNIGVTDLRYSGDHFTWRDCNLDNPLMRKLDRVLVNEYWLENFDMSRAVFLPRGLSDHNPAAVTLGLHSDKIPKPFQVFNHLLELPDFIGVVKHAWEDNIEGDAWMVLTSKLKRVKMGLKELNTRNGNLNLKVEMARQNLLCFQSSMSPQSSQDVLAEEIKLMRTLQSELDSQEVLLKQKSRIRWLNCGDGNNRFFFNSCKSRWNSNKLLALEHEGVTVNTHSAIALVAVNYYKALLGTRKRVSPIPDSFVTHTLSSEVASSMVHECSRVEIFNTLKSMASGKSPGPDGFSVEFFLKSWDVVGSDLSSAINLFFINSFMPRRVNSAAIVLVPKVATASNISQFRPISCCNVIYKVVSKILAQRMKNVMPRLVSPSQTAFIHGRKLGDHILLAQALCKDYHLNSGPPRIAFKLDISKAFDSLNWDFLFDLLRIQGFHQKFIGWLKACISSSMVSVKVNGALEGYFNCSSGLKQGDPISPYLFVLAMEALSVCINLETQSPQFRFHSRTKNAEISHLIFADDVMLFCYGDNDSVSAMLRAVNRFAEMSGLVTNPAKCVTFFGNVPTAVQDFTIAVSGFNRGVLPVVYLGLPLISGKLHKRDCQPLITKICNKFEHWSSKIISQAGRGQLIKSVIFGIQNHWSGHLFLPKLILKRIQGYMARFLWCGRIRGPCHFKVAWKTCCLRKDEGGLGFKELLSWNDSAVLLQLWRIITNKDDSLWIRWVHRVLLTRSAFWTTNVPSKCSWGLRKILNARHEAKQFITYRVGEGSTFLLWHDLWAGQVPLIHRLGFRALSSLQSTEFACVSSIILDGVWNMGVSNDSSIRDLRTICANIPIGHQDEILWGGAVTRSLNIGDIWECLRPTGIMPPWFNFIWCKFKVHKFAFTSWLVVLGRLLTKDRMRNLRMNVNIACVMCGMADETHEHLFHQCSYVQHILSSWNDPLCTDWGDICHGIILENSRCGEIKKELAYLFMSAVFFHIWKERNVRVHNSGNHSTAASLLGIIKRNIRERLVGSKIFQQAVSQDISLTSYLY